VIFPEGTRTAPGTRQPYQPGVAALYRQLGLPLVPVAVNSGVFWGRRHFAKRPGRITLEILPPIPPGDDRRAVMAELEECIETASARLVAEARGGSAAAPGLRGGRDHRRRSSRADCAERPPRRKFAEEDWDLRELPTGHWAMFSAPDRVAEMLHDIAG